MRVFLSAERSEGEAALAYAASGPGAEGAAGKAVVMPGTCHENPKRASAMLRFSVGDTAPDPAPSVCSQVYQHYFPPFNNIHHIDSNLQVFKFCICSHWKKNF